MKGFSIMFKYRDSGASREECRRYAAEFRWRSEEAEKKENFPAAAGLAKDADEYARQAADDEWWSFW